MTRTRDELIRLLALEYASEDVQTIDERTTRWHRFQDEHREDLDQLMRQGLLDRGIPKEAVELAGFTWMANGPRRIDKEAGT